MKKNIVLDQFLYNINGLKKIIKIINVSMLFLSVFTFPIIAINSDEQGEFFDANNSSTIINKLINGIDKKYNNTVVCDDNLEFQQLKTIRGKVLDSEGEPVIGVTIILKNNPSHGTISDIDGNFILSNVPDDAILQATYVGMIPQEISTKGMTTIEIIMESAEELLDELVVIGYGTQKKINLTGAVSQVSSEILEDRPISNIGQGLQGAIPNLNVTQTTGTTGSGASFNIRGYTSITGGEPLILVNGIPKDINLLNPNDIESVTVLKDAASAAIYGARAAFGVILITTKTGKKSDKPKIQLSMNYGINHPTVKFSTMDSKQRMEYMNTASYMQNGTPYYQFDDETVKYLMAYYNDPENNPSAYPDPNNPNLWKASGNTDWPRTLLLDYMPQEQYTASIQGGTDNLDYYTSLSYFRQKGIPRQFDEKYERYNLMSNLNYDVTKWATIGTKISYNKSYKYYPPNNSAGHHDEYNTAFQWHQWANFPIYAPDGNYFSNGSVPNMVQFYREAGYRSRDINEIWLTGLAKLTPLKNTSINVDYSVNITQTEELNYWKPIEMYYVDGSVSGYFPYTNPSQVTHSYYKNRYYTLNTYADYENTFGKHYLKAMIGFNQEEGKYSNFFAKRENLIVETIPFINLASGEKYVGDGASHVANRGVFMRINYNFDNRYLFEFNGRYDGSSRFPKENRFKFFPSASFGWRLDKEPIFSTISNTFNLLKLRVSYGNLGNQNVSELYPYIAAYSSGQANYIIDGERPMTLYAPGLVSPTLTWETVTQYNLGIDFGVFNNRLNASFDVYRRDTKNMLTKSVTLPAVIAVSEPLMNAANLKTTGWDLTVEWRQLSGKVSWGVKVLLSDYSSVITKYDNPSGLLSDFYVGKKLGEIWGFVTKGIAQTDEEAQALDMSNLAGRQRGAGDLIFEDLNNDQKITYGNSTLDDPGDRKVIGNDTPRYSFGVSTDLKWKGFDMTIFFQGIAKRDIWLSNSYWIGGYNNEWLAHNVLLSDFWTPENKDAFFPRPIITGGTDVTAVQTRWLQNAAYLRLKELTLGYTFTSNFTERIKINKLRVFFSGNNIWEITGIFKHKLLADPEMTATNQTPINRTYSFGLNINF